MGNRSACRLAIVVTAAVAAFAIDVTGQSGAATPAPDPSPRPAGILAGQVVDAVTGRPVAGVSLSCGGGPNGDVLLFNGSLAVNRCSAVRGDCSHRPGLRARFCPTAPADSCFATCQKGTTSFVRRRRLGISWAATGRIDRTARFNPSRYRRTTAKLATSRFGCGRTSAIGGTVVDETGEPLVGLGVIALRRTMANGMARLTSAMTANTDDRGAYRMPTLGPGDYLVAVTASLTTIPTSTADAYAQAMSSGRKLREQRDLPVDDEFRDASSVERRLSGG